MRLLLDTHTFLWWLDDNEQQLSNSARSALMNAHNECFLSIASCWEMAIKSSLGKLRLTKPIERFIPEELNKNNFRLLPMDFRHVAKIEALPFHHRDPFDRILVAQSLTEKIAIVSADAVLSEYGVKRIW